LFLSVFCGGLGLGLGLEAQVLGLGLGLEVKSLALALALTSLALLTSLAENLGKFVHEICLRTDILHSPTGDGINISNNVIIIIIIIYLPMSTIHNTYKKHNKHTIGET